MGRNLGSLDRQGLSLGGDHILDTIILWVAMDVPFAGKGRKRLCKVALDVGKEHSVCSCRCGLLIFFFEPGKMVN